ncbi:hypothetical protein K0M31_000437 [Melipona bicolor]|uniref:Uncharacterized protein n=1 Tax=Melipona bicolor TaxID=60889 RepID=A0AA40GEU8_9HYME|nr:hypothetical protein K0M31_000437 [Melipona bicolor]
MNCSRSNQLQKEPPSQPISPPSQPDHFTSRNNTQHPLPAKRLHVTSSKQVAAPQNPRY